MQRNAEEHGERPERVHTVNASLAAAGACRCLCHIRWVAGALSAFTHTADCRFPDKTGKAMEHCQVHK